MPALASWPRWQLIRTDIAADPAPAGMEDQLARARAAEAEAETIFMVNGYRAVIDRAERRIELQIAADELAESLLHPWLSTALAVALQAEGGFSLHGAAIVVDGRGWGILGTKGAGKSTTVAELAARGVPVLSDDTIALRDGLIFAGPRFLDLRRALAPRFPQARPLGRVALRHRWRLDLTGPVPAEVPLAGYLALDWGEQVRSEVVPVGERFGLLGNSRLFDAPESDSHHLLEQMGLPMLRITRPRDFAALDEFLDALLRAARSAAS